MSERRGAVHKVVQRLGIAVLVAFVCAAPSAPRASAETVESSSPDAVVSSDASGAGFTRLGLNCAYATRMVVTFHDEPTSPRGIDSTNGSLLSAPESRGYLCDSSTASVASATTPSAQQIGTKTFLPSKPDF